MERHLIKVTESLLPWFQTSGRACAFARAGVGLCPRTTKWANNNKHMMYVYNSQLVLENSLKAISCFIKLLLKSLYHLDAFFIQSHIKYPGVGKLL